MPPGAHASCNALLQLLLCSAAELGSDSIPDPIRFKPSRFRGLPVRQRVARLRLLIYTSCGAAAAATAAAPGAATATASASATATASASEVQRSRRVAAMATAAWKFIYFTAMIWQYFNGNRISPSSTHFSLFSNLATLSLHFSFSILFLHFSLYTLLAPYLLSSFCTLLSPLYSFSTLLSVLSSHTPLYTIRSLLSSLFTLHSFPIHCSLSPPPFLTAFSTFYILYSSLSLLYSSLSTLFLPPVAFLSFRSCCRFVAAVVRALAADNQGQQTRVPHPQHPIPIPMPSCVLTSCKLWTCSSSRRINRTASVEITFNLQ